MFAWRALAQESGSGTCCSPRRLRVEGCDTVSPCLKKSKTQWYKVGQLQLEGRSGCPWRDRLPAVSALLFSGIFR